MSDFHDIYYRGSDDINLYARDYPHNSTDENSRGTIVCMHGLTRNSADFDQLCKTLNKHYRLLAVDQRGRGLSAWDTNPDNYSPLVYVQDMFALLDYLELEKVLLIGTSMGGLIAMIMAAMQPGRIAGLVLNDVGPELDASGLNRIKNYAGRAAPVSDWAAAIAQTKTINAAQLPNLTDDEWDIFTHQLYREDQTGRPVLAYDPAIAIAISQADENAVPQDLWPVFEQIAAIPMLVLRGESSDILAPACVAKMQQLSPGLVYQSVPNRGHAPLLNEAESLSAIITFVNRVLPDS